MAEGGTLTSMVRKMVSKAEPYIPQVPKPKKKLTLQTFLLMFIHPTKQDVKGYFNYSAFFFPLTFK